ncbi:MAG: hypothetical protein KGI59_01775 [Patescibacteria group bacterium]|nr:hypothetical protein [Patescibacteria group bacterium]
MRNRRNEKFGFSDEPRFRFQPAPGVQVKPFRVPISLVVPSERSRRFQFRVQVALLVIGIGGTLAMLLSH